MRGIEFEISSPGALAAMITASVFATARIVLTARAPVLVVGAGTRPRDAVLDEHDVAVVVGLCLAVGDVRDEHPALGRHAELEAFVFSAKVVPAALFGRVDTTFRSAVCFRHGFLGNEKPGPGVPAPGPIPKPRGGPGFSTILYTLHGLKVSP